MANGSLWDVSSAARAGTGRTTMVELVLIGLGSTVTAVLAARLLDRLLDFDLLAARADDDQPQLED